MCCSWKMSIHPLHDIIPATTHYFFSCNLQPRFWRTTWTYSIFYMPMMISDNFCSLRLRLPKDGEHLRKTFFSPLCQVIGLIVLSTLPSIWRLIIASMVAQIDNQWKLQQLSASKRPWWYFPISMSSRIHLLKQMRSNWGHLLSFFYLEPAILLRTLRINGRYKGLCHCSWRTMILHFWRWKQRMVPPYHRLSGFSRESAEFLR